jgi:DNA-binding LacI/PurR family transcriptional regulator
VPEDTFPLLGFDDLFITSRTHPPLTTVVSPDGGWGSWQERVF